VSTPGAQFLGELRLIKGKALGIEEGKALGNLFSYDYRSEVEPGICFDQSEY
jgi:hypothetical protein